MKMLYFNKLIDVQQEKMYRIYTWPIYEAEKIDQFCGEKLVEESNWLGKELSAVRDRICCNISAKLKMACTLCH